MDLSCPLDALLDSSLVQRQPSGAETPLMIGTGEMKEAEAEASSVGHPAEQFSTFNQSGSSVFQDDTQLYPTNLTWIHDLTMEDDKAATRGRTMTPSSLHADRQDDHESTSPFTFNYRYYDDTLLLSRPLQEQEEETELMDEDVGAQARWLFTTVTITASSIMLDLDLPDIDWRLETMVVVPLVPVFFGVFLTILCKLPFWRVLWDLIATPPSG